MIFGYLFLFDQLSFRKEELPMKDNLIGKLRIMKDCNMKPNFSSLLPSYRCDRHTAKKIRYSFQIFLIIGFLLIL